jgi:4,5-DOPA dioxygenase extradiol
MSERPEDAPALRDHPDFRRAVPTDEHFVPLLYVAGVAAAAGVPLEPFAQGYAFGSLSMTCYGLSCAPAQQKSAGPSASLPDPRVVPTDATNT